MKIKIIGLANGTPSPCDGSYILEYYPPQNLPDGTYGNNHLIVTQDLSQAKEFPDLMAAFEYWRQSCGIRADGKPNRPLTAYTVEIVK